MTRTRYWIGLGSNLGDRLGALSRAVAELGGRGLEIEAASRVWETAPRELEDQPAFLNAAVRARSAMDPPAVLAACKGAERSLGRRPGVRFGPRVIDCDVLVWEGGAWSDERLEVPHPRLAERRFALLPLLDLDPGLVLADGRRLDELLALLDPADQPAEPLGPGTAWALGR